MSASATAKSPSMQSRAWPRAKASAAAASHPDAVVLGADTTVVIRGEALAKPADAADATRMLRLLSGRTHDVLTGSACACSGSRRLVHVEPTRVRMARMSEAEIAWYVSTGEPFDKAGGYAVQGLASRFVEGIDGLVLERRRAAYLQCL